MGFAFNVHELQTLNFLSVMDKDSRVIIIGAGIFGLCTAHQLACEGYRNIIVLDRHIPPVDFFLPHRR